MSPKEREILKRLAVRVREIAATPENERRREMWYRHNALQSERPMILCYPEGAWCELLPESALECTDEKLRAWEKQLRMTIYRHERIGDDAAIEPCFNINWHVACSDYGVAIPMHHGENRGSYVWDPPIADIANDRRKLKFRQLSVDRRATGNDVELARSIFGDVLNVRIRGGFWWTLGLTNTLIRLIGLEQLMLAMYDQPDDLKALMAWMRDETMNFIEWFERENLLTPNNEDGYTGSGGMAYTHELPQDDYREGAPVRLKDLWGFAESQETVGVSPAMFDEFIFPYQLPLLEKFGLNCYGCCEAVHERYASIRKIPNLRRVSVAPWADQEKMAAFLGKDVIFSRKPNPSQICVSFAEEKIRADIAQTVGIAGGCNLEIVMKDTHTVEGHPERITRWVEIAREEVEKTAG